MSDPKNDAQDVLKRAVARCPVGVYTHCKGGKYVVYSHSLDEETLTPLVHYYSLGRGTRWTRTIANFIERVGPEARFTRERDATVTELHLARATV